MFLSASISTYNFVNTEVQITQERKINETSFRIQLIQFLLPTIHDSCPRIWLKWSKFFFGFLSNLF